MKPWTWIPNAALRTLRGALPSLAAPDDRWAEARLPAPERRLYRTMDPRDRHHAIRVARELLARHPGASATLVRAALLHDVGKARRPYRVAERIAVHLVRLAPPPPEPPATGFRGARQVAAHHAAYGARAIRAAGGDERVATLVERHERPGDDPEAALLRGVDRRT